MAYSSDGRDNGDQQRLSNRYAGEKETGLLSFYKMRLRYLTTSARQRARASWGSL